MSLITEKDRIKEFENIKEILSRLDIAAEILKAGERLEESCLLLSMPTNMEDWRAEFEEDLHLATGYLVQMGEEEEQQTKYLMLYMPIQVDLSGCDELEILRFANKTNETLPVGTCFCKEDEESGRMLLQIKCIIGGYVDEFLDEGVVCEAVYELGYAYDRLKQELQELTR